ncbi:MAG TPA: MATE family efflux transporter [Candidatus Blautia faecipullorum]|nr:MATE family efflux transporter [Candidatus Blautia faecipullorum]
MLASALYQLIDGILVGQILGDAPFAALNLAMPFVVINFSLADLIGVGSAVPISISLGKKEEKEADNYFTCACLMIVAAGILLGSVLFFLAYPLLRLMGAQGELLEFAVQYLRVYALCAPVTTIIFAVDNYLRICGRIRASMLLNIFMSVLTAILEFTFLYIFRWGIWGAGLATCTGMFVCTVIAFYPFFRGKMQLHFCRPKFSGEMIKKIVSCGSPNFLNNIAGRITSILMNFLLMRMGGAQAVSVYGILMYADGFVQPLLYGMCDSLQPAVGYNLGAGNKGRIRSIEKCCYTASAAVSLLSAAAMLLFTDIVVRMFVSSPDSAFMEMAHTAVQLFAFTYLTRWFSFATQSYMVAVDRPREASIISLSTALLFPVILVGVFWPLGLTGIWLNFAGTSLLAGILSAVILRRYRHV